MSKTKKIFGLSIIAALLLFVFLMVPTNRASALSVPVTTIAESGCGSDGSGHWAITTSIDFGCQGGQCQAPPSSAPSNGNTGSSSSSPSTSTPAGSSGTTPSSGTGYCYGTAHNAMIDLLFAIIKFISDGIGLIIIMSLIIAGIQYTFSRGEPQAINSATKRIQSSVTALVIFIFAYALLNFLVPNGIFGQ